MKELTKQGIKMLLATSLHKPGNKVTMTVRIDEAVWLALTGMLGAEGNSLDAVDVAAEGAFRQYLGRYAEEG